MVQDDLPLLLLNRGAHASEDAALLEEIRVHIELAPGVDGEIVAWAIGSVGVPRVLMATTAVASRVMPVDRFFATVRGCLEGMVVCFHDLYLGAPLPADLVRITIVWRLPLAVGARVRLSVVVEGGRGNEVDGQVARATDTAEVHGEAELPAQKLELRNAARQPLLLARSERRHARIVPYFEVIASTGRILSCQPHVRVAVNV
mmetsp:Transcript_15358/g.38297  ORF Transcript_15358/g.38297 Transcript_15358/m.38297 type:complete len:203 (+) Transcript_15358:1261-1869(+)